MGCGRVAAATHGCTKGIAAYRTLIGVFGRHESARAALRELEVLEGRLSVGRACGHGGGEVFWAVGGVVGLSIWVVARVR